jgi:hypothetical protein
MAVTEDDEPLPIPLPIVEEALKLLSKAVRARLLYLPNNPNYAKAAELMGVVFAPMWQHADVCVLTVNEHSFQYGSRVVYKEEAQANDSLPWLFFKDGVRELRFLPGFEGEESVKFLDLVVRARKALPDEDDLLTLLWQAEFQTVRYRYVDVGVEGTVPLEYEDGEPVSGVLVDSWGETSLSDARGGFGGGIGGDGPEGAGIGGAGVGGAGVGEGIEGKGDAGGAPGPGMPRPSGVVSMSDFDTALYFLDDSEIEYLRSEIRKEYARDERINVVSMLLDIFELQTDILVREEIVGILDAYILQLLSAGQYRAVAYLLTESAAALPRARELESTHRTRIGALADRLSQAETLSQLLQAMDDAPELPPQEELTELFTQLKASSLKTVFAWLGKLSKPKLRGLLEAAAGALAAQNTAELVKLINVDERDVALEAARRSGALRTPAAVGPLGKLLTDPAADMRLTAVSALSEIATPGALQLLEKMVDDPDREVRVATLRTIAARAYRPALARLEAAVKGKAAKERDLTEKMATFEAYGAIAGDAGVPLLDGLLNSKGFLGRREDPETRACAAMALGRMNSAKARESLQKAAADPKDEIVVRTAVNKALRGGGP